MEWSSKPLPAAPTESAQTSCKDQYLCLLHSYTAESLILSIRMHPHVLILAGQSRGKCCLTKKKKEQPSGSIFAFSWLTASSVSLSPLSTATSVRAATLASPALPTWQWRARWRGGPGWSPLGSCLPPTPCSTATWASWSTRSGKSTELVQWRALLIKIYDFLSTKHLDQPTERTFLVKKIENSIFLGIVGHFYLYCTFKSNRSLPKVHMN